VDFERAEVRRQIQTGAKTVHIRRRPDLLDKGAADRGNPTSLQASARRPPDPRWQQIRNAATVKAWAADADPLPRSSMAPRGR
jgi:hypothetical protein